MKAAVHIHAPQETTIFILMTTYISLSAFWVEVWIVLIFQVYDRFWKKSPWSGFFAAFVQMRVNCKSKCTLTLTFCQLYAGTQETISQWYSEQILYFLDLKLTLINKAGWILSFQSFSVPFIYSFRNRGEQKAEDMQEQTRCLCKKSIQQGAQSCLLFHFLRYEPE